jgi:hypothetical protein
MAPRTIHFTYSKAFFSSALRHYFWRLSGWGFVVPFAFLCALAVWQLSVGDRGWPTVALVTLIVVLSAVMAGTYALLAQSSGKWVSELGERPVSFTTTEQGFTYSSELGSSTLPWSLVKAVELRPGFLMILLARTGGFIAVPRASLDAEHVQEVLSHASKAGARVP